MTRLARRYRLAIAALLLASIGLAGEHHWPPSEAFEDSPPFAKWAHIETRIQVSGVATVRLRHPENPRIVAVLHYKLVYAAIVEMPEGAAAHPAPGP